MNLSFLKVKKDRIFIIAIVLVGIVVGNILYNILLKGTQSKMNKTLEKEKIAVGEIKRQNMMQQEVKRFKKEHLIIESKTLKFKELIPFRIKTTEFIKLLEELSKKYKLRGMKADIFPLQKLGNSLFSRTIAVYCEGQYFDIIEFFKALQNFKYLLNIEEIEILRKSQIVPLIGVNFKISIFQSSPKQ